MQVSQKGDLPTILKAWFMYILVVYCYYTLVSLNQHTFTLAVPKVKIFRPVLTGSCEGYSEMSAKTSSHLKARVGKVIGFLVLGSEKLRASVSCWGVALRLFSIPCHTAISLGQLSHGRVFPQSHQERRSLNKDNFQCRKNNQK